MNLGTICNFFGGSIFSEEYRTNFSDLDERIDAVAQTVTPSSLAVEQASLSLLRAVNHILRGELALARVHLDTISRLTQSGSDPEWQLRCSLYDLFLTQQQRSPPILRFRADYDNPSAARRDIELSIKRCTEELMQRSKSSNSVGRIIERLETDLILNIGGFVKVLWDYACPNHPSFPRNSFTISRVGVSTMLYGTTEPYAESLLRSSEELGLGPVNRYLKRLSVEYSSSAGEAHASGRLSELYRECLTKQDKIGAANCKLLEADSVLSPPFTNSIALNLITLDQELGWDNDIWDSAEARFPLRKRQKAEDCFLEAFDLFQESGSVRGQASVELRRGCVSHAEAVAQEQSNNPNAQALLLEEAERHLTSSALLFVGDSVHLQIVNTHKILLLISKISSGTSHEAVDKARQVGEWASSMQYTAISQFAGLLMLRFGRTLSTSASPSQAARQHRKAVLCCECARACFGGSKDPVLELSSIIAHAYLHRRIGNLPLARALMIEGRELLLQVDRYISKLIEDSEGRDETLLRSMLVNHTEEYSRAWCSIVGSTESGIMERGMDHGNRPNTPPAITTSIQLASVQDHLFRTPRQLEADYQETMETRRRALLIDADIRTANEVLRRFCDRWDGEAAKTVPQVVLGSMKLAIFHHLGNYEEARRHLSLILPTQYGGRSRTADGMLQIDSTIHGHSVAHRDFAERSLAQCFVAKDWCSAHSILTQMRSLFPGYPEDTSIPQSKDHWQLLVWIAYTEQHCSDLGIAYDRYLEALYLFEQSRTQVRDLDSRRNLTSTIHSGQLFFGLAHIAKHFSAKPDGAEHRTPEAMTWENQILVYLEQGRARALTDLLVATVTPKAQSDMRQEWTTYMYLTRKLTKALNSDSSSGRTEVIRSIGEELKIRQPNVQKVRIELEQKFFGLVPIMEGKLLVSESESDFQCIPNDAICIHINISRDSMMILAITSQGIQLVDTLDITDVEIERTVLTFLEIFRKGPPPAEASQPRPSHVKTFTGLLQKLSKWIIDPVLALLKQKTHVIFIPSRSFHKFPFAALIMEGRHLFLQKNVSQVPSLAALCHLVKKNRRRAGLSSAVIFKSEKRDNRDNECSLYLAGVEAITITELHGCTAYDANVLHAQRFKAIYESSDIVHVATHGLQSGSSPWDSTISLKEKLKVVDIARLHSQASLVCFAACVSGLGEDNIGDDLLGFSHAVIASGASTFLGGLWKVDNLATMILMIFFHRAVAERKKGVSLAACWRQAQVRLYELTKPKLRVFLEELITIWDEALHDEKIPHGISLQPRAAITNILEDDDEYDFTHPYYWAAFVLIGHGGLMLVNEDVKTESAAESSSRAEGC